MKAKRFLFSAPTIFGTPLKYGAPVFIGFTVLISGLEAHGGDILRGGSSASNKPGRAGANTRTAAATDAARANAKDTLARTNKTLASIRAMQNAARQAALKNGANHLGKNPLKPNVKLPDVPNGLVTGGLKVSGTVTTDPSQWTGAKLPVQEVKKNGKTTVTIKQTEQQALLNWETFNVGKKTTVTFDQSKGGADVGKWIAFNKITDPSGNPTEILGNIKADGQIYLINTNGIIFGGGSQVNARGLTASSLPVNTNLIDKGLLNNPDAQFLFSGLAIPAGTNGTPAFTPEAPVSTDGKYGDVIVEKGAVLKSPTDSSNTGGRITLVGPNVTNNGTILTPDGQTILAAGLQVGFLGHNPSDPSLRGLDTFVGAVQDGVAEVYAGTVSQGGLLESERGSITIAGRDIQLTGALVSTTSVSLNGRIDIQANYGAVSKPAQGKNAASFLFNKTGAVSVGADSLISILPEYDSKETTIGSVLAEVSQVNITGKTIYFGEDSTLLAPNAEVNLMAGSWLFLQNGNNPISSFLQAGGQVYLDKNAVIDVAGSTDVEAPVSQNIITVDLRGAELADSPLQREGNLRGKTIQVDIRDLAIYQGEQWVGTPLANIAGFANLIQRSVGQLTVAGGTVNLSAGKSVVMQEGSKIDVSGGSTRFTADMVKTTQLLTSTGRLVDISQATPDVVYEGIYEGTFTQSNIKFGVTDVYRGTLTPGGYRYELGSTQGAAGGALAITAPSMALDGRLLGRTITGEKQRLSPPATSSLTLKFQAQDTTYPTVPIHSPTPPTITFDSGIKQVAAGPFAVDANGDPLDLSAERTDLVVLSPDLLVKDGFGKLTVNNHDGEILVPKSVKIEAPTGGSISFSASRITVDGSVIARGGALSFSTFGLTYDQINLLLLEPATAPLAVSPDRGVFTLGSDGVLSTAGLLIDDRLSQGGPQVSPVALTGGTIKIEGYSADLTKGGRIDVSGGASMSSTGAVSYGSAGSLSIAAGREIGFSSTLGGKLNLGAEMLGLSGGKAGNLAITAPAIQIGGSTSNANVTLLNPGFFSQGGFGAISLSGIGLQDSGVFVPGVLIAGDVEIRPVVRGLLGGLDGNDQFSLERTTREEGSRTPVSLSFGAIGAAFSGQILTRGDIVMSKGSQIETDGGGSVSFNGQTVTLKGSVIAPGGNIVVAGSSIYPSEVTEIDARTTVYLGRTALLSTKGKTILLENALGLRQGRVLAGGTISVSGNIVAEKGAVLDVSGAKGTLDLPPSSKTLDESMVNSLAGKVYVPVTIESNAGAITLVGSAMLFSDAELRGEAGGASATGGVLNVSSGRNIIPTEAYTSADANLVVTQSEIALASTNTSIGVGDVVLDEAGGTAPQLGHIAVDRFEKGGFDSVTLAGNVRFDGDVSITLPGSLRVAAGSEGGVIYAGGKVDLTAGHVALGRNFLPPSLLNPLGLFTERKVGASSDTPYFFGPSYGTGKLTVHADLIDIGDLSLQGIGKANLFAAGGDVRGNGTMQIAGDLVIKAGQIYPPTQSEFNIFVYDHDSVAGSVTIRKGDTRSLPFSAGGALSIYASEIIQNGSLRAPIGTINLGWDGTGSAPVNAIAGSSLTAPVTASLTLGSDSVTSVSAIDPITKLAGIIPYGISFDGNSWIDPAGNDITSGGAPEKRVNLAALDLRTEKGSSIDIRGGGDLYAYRWIPGNGGTKDVLASTGSFAVIPGYGFDYAPYAPDYTGGSMLKVGDQITLAASKGIPAGTYTLLPARYALLPGAYLVTPQIGTAVNTTGAADGSQIVSGYRSNNLNENRTGATIISRYEIADSTVVRLRSEYQDLLSNTVLKEAALENEFVVPRLPLDSGYLSFSSTVDMSLNGAVRSAPGEVLNGKGELTEIGRGGLIDINSSSDILINATGTGGSTGQLVLNASQLNNFGAESLLIGGLRESGPDGTVVTVNTGDLELDNPSEALEGSDIILVSDGKLTLSPGSKIKANLNQDGVFDTLLFGDVDVAGSGNGSLVRMSSNASGGVSRFGVTSPNPADLQVLRDVNLVGGKIVLDSTSATRLATTAILEADDVSLNSGRISIILNRPGTISANAGLVLAGDALSSLQSSAKRLSLLSYSSLDVYGTGTVGTREFESLSLQASSIRGFNTGTGSVKFTAASLILGNSANTTAETPLAGALDGNLLFDADNITLGANAIRLDGFSSTTLSSSGEILVSGEGALDARGDLDLVASLLTGESASKYRIASDGLLQLKRPAGGGSTVAGSGFGADLTLEGARVKVNGDITLPSGKLTLHALTGDLVLGDEADTAINLTGTSETFIDTIRYTSGGIVNLFSETGSVRIDDGTAISVSAQSGGGNAGVINVKTPGGTFELEGSIKATAGSKGLKGSFTLDAGSIAGGSMASLDAVLNAGDFTQSRDYRIRTGDVNIDGIAKSNIYRVAADAGDIIVSDTINASGETGGTIDLKANGSLVLRSTAVLDASAAKFDSAGKGGAVVLEAGNQTGGVVDADAILDLRAGSQIDLTVAAKTSTSESLGKFSGTLHLRAPRTDDNKDLHIEAIGSSITGASSILVEGVKLYGITGAGTITTAIQNTIKSDANAFLGAAGTTTAGYTIMQDRLTALQPSLDLILAPGAEIYNLTGDLILGAPATSISSPGSTYTSDWNLETFRFGPKGAPGVLTLRAKGDLVFYNAISDGFAAVNFTGLSVAQRTALGNSQLWLAKLMARNEALPGNTQSWSYRFTSGADLSSSDYRSILSENDLDPGKGSFLLGKNYGAANFGSGAAFTTAAAISGGNTATSATRYQVIRTGSGDITINSGRDVYLLNQFASIYTAGTVVSEPTKVAASGDFTLPVVSPQAPHPTQDGLGAVQQPYYVQYSMAGGDVSISATGDIAHMTRNVTLGNGGTLIDDSSRQLPNNWLYRRGYIDPVTGEAGLAGVENSTVTDPAASTTWWVDFSNFFEGVGTLGGGNILLSAGNDVKNTDALAPTNARMPSGRPSASKLVELGGGDIIINAGRNIDGGVYYVERGQGDLTAGRDITTNKTRSPSLGIISNLVDPKYLDSHIWLATTLFVGKGGFDVQAGGDLLLGPVANPFLLPQGVNNKFWYKTYFNTYSPDSYVNAISLGGAITHRAVSGNITPLFSWLNTQQLLVSSSSANFQPWSRLAETLVTPFATLSKVITPTLRSTSFSGSVNLVGDITLYPSRSGQIEVLAKDSIIGLQPSGIISNSINVQQWIASSVNLSDADPGSIPGITDPYAYRQVEGVGLSRRLQALTGTTGFLQSIDAKFLETGSTSGALEDEQTLHTPGNLHRGDDEPVRLFALDGNIEGLNLFSPKETRVIAGNDIGDISFYIQNLSSSDISVVSAGRDLTPYNPNTDSRTFANVDISSNPAAPKLTPLAGDIQISGPGNLQVLAGRNIDLGLDSTNSGAGITSIGNNRNPYLGAEGASLTVGAGIGPATGLAGSLLAFDKFITDFATSPDGDRYLAEVRGILGLSTSPGKQGAMVTEVTAGSAADVAGVQKDDILLRISGNKIDANYDDSYLKSGSGIEIGKETKLQVLRDGKRLTLDIKPGGELLDLADPLLSAEQQKQLALSVFFLALRDTGRDYNNPDSPGFGEYKSGFDAIKSLFPKSISWAGEILTQGRDIRTRSGGDINIFAPGGGLTLADSAIGSSDIAPGIVTESGGTISIFTDQDVNIGIGRIFTLKGGNISIWSSKGDIAAGNSSRTVSSAPPTRVILDPQSAAVETDLAGLATGGGIGVLATVEGVAPGNVDLIAPTGIIDAGDAGISASGGINLAAATIVNAQNISSGGATTGAPSTSASGPSISTVTNAANTVAANNEIANKEANQAPPETQATPEDTLSIITVDVLGYGDAGTSEEDEEDEEEAQ